MLLRITDILNEDNLLFKMRISTSSLVAFRFIVDYGMKCNYVSAKLHCFQDCNEIQRNMCLLFFALRVIEIVDAG
jgi:hypothetical protein